MDKQPIHVISLEGELKCQICHEVSVSPVYSCLVGHIVCGICFDTDESWKHGNCKELLSPSPLAERLLKKHNVQLACRNNVKWCCKYVIKAWYMKPHFDICKKRIACFEKNGQNCEFPSFTNFQEFTDHLLNHHKCDTGNKADESDDWFTFFFSNRALENKEYTVFPSMLFKFEGRDFILHEIHKWTTVYRWMSIIPENSKDSDETTAISYNYSLKISPQRRTHQLSATQVGDNPLYTWNLPVLLLEKHQFFQQLDFSDKTKFASIEFKNLMRICQASNMKPGELPYKWVNHVKITEITKETTEAKAK